MTIIMLPGLLKSTIWSHKNCLIFSTLPFHNSLSICNNKTVFITHVEFNGESFNLSLQNDDILFRFILLNNYIGVICAQMVDFCRLGHIVMSVKLNFYF